LKNLTQIDLGSTSVTDAGLVHLSELKNLRMLWFDRSLVTDKGIEDLRKALPDCVIHR
jgi:hypothetical protein